ncbi:ferredoxin [Candidatus Woesearchaeota archaeon]|nr:ferredoxin [Candidatus Woesearchaeota archaeon]
MAKYKITYDRANCIGAGACAAMSPNLFKMTGDGKADLLGGKDISGGKFEIEVDENPIIVEVAKACPVEVIKIKNLETGADLV